MLSPFLSYFPVNPTFHAVAFPKKEVNRLDYIGVAPALPVIVPSTERLVITTTKDNIK
jgi:hypothetical protein